MTCQIRYILLSLLHAPAVFAFQPLITDDTGTQGSGGNQVEFSWNRQRLESTGDTTRTFTRSLTYTRGITDAIDVYGGVSQVRVGSPVPGTDTHGHGNPVLGLKWRFYENEDEKFSVGFKPEIQFHASADYEERGLGNGHNGYSGTLILTRETAFGAVHLNYAFTQVNYALDANRNAHRRHLHRLNVAPVFELAEQWQVGVDLGLTTNSHRTERAAMGYAELGVIWSPGKDLDFALGWIAFLGDGEPRSSTLTAGVTWRFK
jgi:hypothetical protein